MITEETKQSSVILMIFVKPWKPAFREINVHLVITKWSNFTIRTVTRPSFVAFFQTKPRLVNIQNIAHSPTMNPK
jgi:hypothetical protein